jgi:hypothetical protein
MSDYQVYYEGGTVDRHWVAPAGLSLAEARKRRIGILYKTAWGAQQKLVRLTRPSHGSRL